MPSIQQERLDQALARRGAPMTAEEWLSVLDELVDSTAALSAAEQSFLLAHGGVAADDLAPGRQAAALEQIALATERAYAEVAETAYTTSEVMSAFGLRRPNIHRMVANGDLYSVSLPRRREHVFPRWQFTGHGPLRGLRPVLAAVPAGYHPLDVAAVMTTPDETLGGRSPVEWLASGGDPERVVELMDALDAE